MYIFRLSGFADIRDRLIDSVNEVLDVLSIYVFGRKLDHKNDQHIIDLDLNNENVNLINDQLEAVKKMEQVELIHKYNTFCFIGIIKYYFFSYQMTYLEI